MFVGGRKTIFERVLTIMALAMAMASVTRKMTTSALSSAPKFNFGAASSKIPLAFGIEAPGVPMKPGGKYNDPESVPTEVMNEWTDFLKENNVKRTLCLLNPKELDCYSKPGYASFLEEQGITPACVNVFEEDASEKLLEAYKAAVESGEKIAVHCSGGEGRTGVVLGALLMKEAGLTVEEAEAEVMSSAESAGVVRKLSPDKVNKLLDSGTLG